MTKLSGWYFEQKYNFRLHLPHSNIKMLVLDPKKRITAEQALKHPWISVSFQFLNVLGNALGKNWNLLFKYFLKYDSSNEKDTLLQFIVKKPSTASKNSMLVGNSRFEIFFHGIQLFFLSPKPEAALRWDFLGILSRGSGIFYNPGIFIPWIRDFL